MREVVQLLYSLATGNIWKDVRCVICYGEGTFVGEESVRLSVAGLGLWRDNLTGHDCVV